MSMIARMLESMIIEGYLDGEGKPIGFPKLDANAAQNPSIAPPPISSSSTVGATEPKERAPIGAVNKPVNGEREQGKAPEGEEEPKTEAKAWIKELEAANAGMMLAEYHIEKANACKTESEDVDFEKLGAAHKIITDTRKALTEMYSQACKKDKTAE